MYSCSWNTPCKQRDRADLVDVAVDDGDVGDEAPAAEEDEEQREAEHVRARPPFRRASEVGLEP